MDAPMRASAGSTNRISPSATLGKKRQRSNSPAAGPSKRAKAINNSKRDGSEDGDSVIDVEGEKGEESEEEYEDKYAVQDQRLALKREADADNMICDFCINFPLRDDGTSLCNRKIIDGWLFECTMCANHRAQSGNLDHKCLRAGQHPDLQVFKRYSEYHPVDFPQPISCEECKANKKVKTSRCDADPFLQLRCSGCMRTKDSDSKLCLVQATTGDADLGWGHDVGKQMGPKPTLQKGRVRWFRRECDICKSKPDKARGGGCSWLDSRDTGEPGDPRKPCTQCTEGNMSCFDGGMLVGHPNSLELPTEWSTRGDLGGGWVELRGDKGVVTRPQCRQCHAQKRHCRASAKHAEYACNWCWQTGMVCQDLKDENKIYPLFDLSRVGIGNFCPFARCGQCEATGRNCDRQRPCDSCFFNGQGDLCDTWHAGSRLTLNCLDRRINNGDDMMVKPGPLYYLSMGYGPEGVNDKKNGTQIEHYIGPPFPRYAFKTVADRPGEVPKQTKQAIVAATLKMRSALTARGAPPNGAPGGELHGMNVNEITLDQLRAWMLKRWPTWTRQCERKDYVRYRNFEIVSKAYSRSNAATGGGGLDTNSFVEDLGEGEEDLQMIPDTTAAFTPLNMTGEGNPTGNSAAVAAMVSTTSNVANNAAFTMPPEREQGWWTNGPDLPNIPNNLLPTETKLRFTLLKSELCDDMQLSRWPELLGKSMPPSEQAVWEDYYDNPYGTSDFGLFSIKYGSLYRHSPINQVLRGISWTSTNVQLRDFRCIDQRRTCAGLAQTACQDVEHSNPGQAVCEPCAAYGNHSMFMSEDRINRFDIIAMRAYFCTPCHKRLIGSPRSITELYLLGAKSVWGCRFANNATIDGSLTVNGRKMEFYPFENPITGCTCGGNIFNARLCLADRVKYARYAMYQADKVRNWRSKENDQDLCPMCLIHQPEEKANASPSFSDLLSADGTSTEETVSWACLVCGGMVLNQLMKNTLIGGWYSWFPTATVSWCSLNFRIAPMSNRAYMYRLMIRK